MANWEEIKFGSRGVNLPLNTFGVKNLKAPFKYEANTGRHFNWFCDTRNKVVVCLFDNKFKKVAKEIMSIPHFVPKFFKEDDAICYRTEDAIYLSPYKLGEEHLKAFLKAEKVIR